MYVCVDTHSSAYIGSARVYVRVCVDIYVCVCVELRVSLFILSSPHLKRGCVFWVEEAWKGMRVLSLNDFCCVSCGLDQKLPVTGLEGIWKCPRAARRRRPCAPYCGVGVRRAVSPRERTAERAEYRWGCVSVSPQSAEGRAARLAREGHFTSGSGQQPGGGGSRAVRAVCTPAACVRARAWGGDGACPNRSRRRSAALIPPCLGCALAQGSSVRNTWVIQYCNPG